MTISDNSFLAGVLGGNAAAGNRLFEPQRSNNGMLTINGLSDFSPDGTDTLKLALASFPLPKVQTNQSQIQYLNETRKFAGNTTYSDMTVSFHDYVDRLVANTLWKWRYAIHDPRSGLNGLKSQYAKSGVIDLFAPNNDTNYSRQYNLMNIWPADVDFGNIDFSSDEPVRITVQFAIDKMMPSGDFLSVG